MDLTDLLAGPPASLPSWTYRVYDRIRGQRLPEETWNALFGLGVTAALAGHDRDGLHAVLGLAMTYFDSIGDQFGCLPYIEETMQRVASDPTARAVVLDCTRDLMIGNS